MRMVSEPATAPSDRGVPTAARAAAPAVREESRKKSRRERSDAIGVFIEVG
jgi:hypothetical protein